MSFLTSFLGGVGLKILGAAAAALAVAAILLGARSAGRSAERVEHLERSLENARVAREVERDTRALDDDDLDDFLRRPEARRRR